MGYGFYRAATLSVLAVILFAVLYYVNTHQPTPAPTPVYTGDIQLPTL